ncbi:hypothetical protein GQR36_00880 [Enterococcus termitis]
MEKKEIKIGAQYVCHGSSFSWFFVGEAISKKKTMLKLESLNVTQPIVRI